MGRDLVTGASFLKTPLAILSMAKGLLSRLLVKLSNVYTLDLFSENITSTRRENVEEHAYNIMQYVYNERLINMFHQRFL